MLKCADVFTARRAEKESECVKEWVRGRGEQGEGTLASSLLHESVHIYEFQGAALCLAGLSCRVVIKGLTHQNIYS